MQQHVISEPFDPSPFMPEGTRVFEDDFISIGSKEREADADQSLFLPMNEKESNTRENNVAKIKVVWVVQGAVDVDIGANPSAEGGEDDEGVDDQVVKVVDIVDTFSFSFVGESMHDDGSLVFAYYKEAYMEKHDFCFDTVLDEHVSNDEVYRVTVQPIIPTIFERTKATCFAYGQTDVSMVLDAVGGWTY
ncbi:unnamed protein product [Lupinus luteus]|uniref:Kinesin motor domain-containing protein n=1 Tax=Lupinus luteus TaxID=3873 RepID=A0AAV1XZ46_LUPLU